MEENKKIHSDPPQPRVVSQSCHEYRLAAPGSRPSGRTGTGPKKLLDAPKKTSRLRIILIRR
jgi:hypothetical protein